MMIVLRLFRKRWDKDESNLMIGRLYFRKSSHVINEKRTVRKEIAEVEFTRKEQSREKRKMNLRERSNIHTLYPAKVGSNREK